MKKIAIYGAGGFGKEIHQLIDRINSLNQVWEIIGYFDDGVPVGANINGLKVLGSLAILKKIQINQQTERIKLWLIAKI